MNNINTFEKAYKNSRKLAGTGNSSLVLKRSLKILLPRKGNFFRKLVFFLIEIVVGYIVSVQTNTITMTNNIMQVILTVIIAFSGIVFTGYAFFQALINNKLLITLLSIEDDENKGTLPNTNKYFSEVLIFQILCIAIDLLVIIATIILPDTWAVFISNKYNVIMSTVVVSFLLHVNFEGIWEMKSFVFNVFQLFNLHSMARMDEIKEKKDLNK